MQEEDKKVLKLVVNKAKLEALKQELKDQKVKDPVQDLNEGLSRLQLLLEKLKVQLQRLNEIVGKGS